MWDQWLEDARKIAYRSVFVMSSYRHDRAEDAAQEGVLASVGMGEEHFNDRLHLIRWVAKAARNSFRNVQKLAYEERRANLSDTHAAADTIRIQEELPALIQQGFDKIGEPCREILNLYYFNGLTDMQIAMKQLGDQAIDANRQIINRQRRNCLDEFRWLLFEDGFDPKDWL